MDPWGHLVPTIFRNEIEEKGLDVRPSIAVTKAHLKMSELDDAERRGDIAIDGHIVLKSAISGIEVNVSKAAVEPVWYMPGVAERFGMYVEFFPFFFLSLIDTDESLELN